MTDMDTGHFLCEARILYDQVRSRDEYPFNLPAFKNLHGLKFHPKVTYVIGENGMGKSTLLEAIAIALGLILKAVQRICCFRQRIPIRPFTSTCA